MSAEPSILVVEDDTALGQVMVEELEAHGYHAHAVTDLSAARDRRAEWPPTLILCDLKLEQEDGGDLLREVRGSGDDVGFIIVTAYGTVQRAVEALKAGADDFVTKPIDFEHLLQRVDRTVEYRRLQRDVAARGPDHRHELHGILAQAPAMKELFDTVRTVGPTDAAVLITGESGTGKELVAHALHLESGRRDAPFVPVNCASVPWDLLESEFFGHAKGAFTGAAGARKGLFAAADGGTLFLDEIAEMPMGLQAKLLRALQDGVFKPVGADAEVHSDVRVVAATNKDLEACVARGEFREDLFYRLETFTVHVPALRERRDDIPLLAARFTAEFADKYGKRELTLSEDSLALLKRYGYPGNVRELRNAIERAVALSGSSEIRAADLPPRMRSRGNGQSGGGAAALVDDGPLVPLEQVQRQYVRHVVDTLGNKKRAAEVLGIARRTLYRYLADEE